MQGSLHGTGPGDVQSMIAESHEWEETAKSRTRPPSY